MSLKLKEAIAYAVFNGNDVSKMDIARALWPDSKEVTQRSSIHKLYEGTTKTFTIEWIKIICEMTGVKVNFLLGFKNKVDEGL